MQRRKDSKNRVLKDGESQRSDGRYQYRFTDALGTRHIIYAKTLQELRQKKEDIKTGSITFNKSDITVNDIFTKAIAIKKSRLKITTVIAYNNCYYMYIKKRYADTKIQAITYQEMVDFYIDMFEKYADNTVLTMKCVFGFIFEYAVKQGVIQKNVSNEAYLDTKPRKNTDGARNCLTEEQVVGLLEFLNTNRTHYQTQEIMTMLLYTGMRASELCGLRWKDVDLKNKVISINHILIAMNLIGNARQSFEQSPKTQKSIRNIPMLPQVYELLVKRKAELNPDKEQLVIANQRGTPYTAATLGRKIKTAIKKYNKFCDENLSHPKIHYCSPHTFRHTFCSLMCMNGVNIKTIQQVMGHSNINTTLDIYTNVSDKFNKNELSKLTPILTPI